MSFDCATPSLGQFTLALQDLDDDGSSPPAAVEASRPKLSREASRPKLSREASRPKLSRQASRPKLSRSVAPESGPAHANSNWVSLRQVVRSGSIRALNIAKARGQKIEKDDDEDEEAAWKVRRNSFRKKAFTFGCEIFQDWRLLSGIFFVYPGIAAIILHIGGVKDSTAMQLVSTSRSALSFFAVFAGFILVFRTQICYGRWWEGRCLWGKLIFASINIAQQAGCWFRTRDGLQRLCRAVVCFGYASKNQLEGHTVQRDTVYLKERALLNDIEIRTLEAREGWRPYYFLGVMRDAANEDLRSDYDPEAGTYHSKTLDSQLLMFEQSLGELALAIGGLIRVKATGLPNGYDFMFYFVFVVFFITTLVAWTPQLGWYAPVLVGVLSVVVRAITLLGDALEDPFGIDITDLPLEKFCHAIEDQVAAVFHDRFPERITDGGWPTCGVDVHPANPKSEKKPITSTARLGSKKGQLGKLLREMTAETMSSEETMESNV